VLDLLTNDSVIFLFGAVGLATTAFSILRDARNQRESGAQTRVAVIADRADKS
jgi:hypothetical protein